MGSALAWSTEAEAIKILGTGTDRCRCATIGTGLQSNSLGFRRSAALPGNENRADRHDGRISGMEAESLGSTTPWTTSDF